MGTALALFASLPSCALQSSEELGQQGDSIIGGAPDSTHKGVVSLLKQVEGGFYPSCSGTLLTQNLVLTAHHCVAPLSSGDAASVECGETEFQEADAPRSILVSVEQNVGREGLTPYRVQEVWVPSGSSEVCGRDIALLMLAGDGVPANVATPIAPRLDSRVQADEAFIAIGYGLQDPEDETGETAGQRMLSTDANVFCDGNACDSDMVEATEFIANSPVCSGDSGGPAIDKSGRVSGVTSRGDVKCTVGIYSSVAAWRDFIVEKTFVAAKSGSYAPPAWAGEPPPGFYPDVDPLGMSCTGACSSGYLCWSASSTPPGICVPPCSASNTTCPSGYSCDTRLSACIQPAAEAPGGAGTDGNGSGSGNTDSSSCAVSAPSKGSGALWLGLSLLGLQLVRRRFRQS